MPRRGLLKDEEKEDQRGLAEVISEDVKTLWLVLIGIYFSFRAGELVVMTAANEEISPTGAEEKSKHLPGEGGIWVFIFGDMMVFSLFFLVFLYYRNLDIETFTAAQSLLNQNMGAANTILLLTSSWFVAMGLHFCRKGVTDAAAKLFGAAFACGVGFGTVKYFEWGEKIRAGHTLTSNDFFMYYYIFTGIHLLHVVIGMAVLIFLMQKARRGQCAAGDIQIYESGGAYWHMVDLLWIVLFPLLYLVR